jgi:4-amino-4-deoxy-L-arabinose transferase-like glycosyltransferase
VIASAALAVGTAAAVYYAWAGLTLSHYDARAHLVVARRVIDSLTPGWQQVGAVWLPLPHLLNMLPVQVDALYRSGASAVAISVISTALTVWALSSLILRTTGSTSGALAAAALLLVNPNLLYLQSTPMTEPLLFATTAAAIALTAAWIDSGARGWPGSAGIALAAACLTRYEAWPVAAATIAIFGAVLMRRGWSVRDAIPAVGKLTAWPLSAVLLFLVNSRWTVGAWFVSGGFFVPENTEALGHPLVAWAQVREGLYRLSGSALVWSAYAGTALVVYAFVRSRSRAPLALVLALAGAAALPCYAYMQGHPFRIRYDAPLVAACAALTGAGIGLLWPRARPFAAAIVVAAALIQAPPLDRTAPLIAESQRDAANMAGRRGVTEYLVTHRDGRTIMMSMGSLGHYMHDLSAADFHIRDFLHEGNGDLWNFALLKPAGVAGWIVIEEHAEGGDSLFLQARRHPGFLDGFERVAAGGGAALYRAR